ncbi:tubulin-specific chaperone E [Schistocerca piceifrons]|uniref:tubulin-specific chaperone E n=1 Tax=Schistocerca piceifrons TaxID=274613 RepID=UPI001F5FEAFA|nr:tubulin-specific chaperone E [Schistocerca piceifrons]XP_047109127.1 tubulin-specific chaperone E [Schistocerca piceifrons]
MIGPNIPGNTTKDEFSLLQLGQRIECSGSYGTVKYIGEVPPTKGIWLGIDWDEPHRGKHDGMYNDVRYFKARFPQSGSFIRPAKANFGVSCPEAIRERYGEVKGDETAGIDRKGLELLQKEINARFLEVVGFDKVNRQQSDFSKLQVVWLREHQVSTAGSPGELFQLCPRIRELDLSRNLLNNWTAVAEIAIQLQFLRILNVSENHLVIPDDALSLKSSFLSLEHIIVGKMSYSWCDVLICATMWPHIHKLQVPFNCITTLSSPPPNILQNLRLLDLEGNKIRHWHEINKLGKLNTLEVLNISNTGVSDIAFPLENEQQKTELFPSLKQLHLSENNISDWKYISELEKLKSLEDLKFRDNPVLQHETVETCFQLIIARIGNLKILNGISVTPEERRGAEYDYMKRHAHSWLSLTSNSEKKEQLNEFTVHHPRYQYLVDKYGAPENGETEVTSHTLKSQLILVEIHVPESKHQPITKRVPRNMTVQKFKGLIQKLFKLENEISQLSCRNKKAPYLEYPIDNDLEELAYFAISDGDHIIAQ